MFQCLLLRRLPIHAILCFLCFGLFFVLVFVIMRRRSLLLLCLLLLLFSVMCCLVPICILLRIVFRVSSQYILLLLLLVRLRVLPQIHCRVLLLLRIRFLRILLFFVHRSFLHPVVAAYSRYVSVVRRRNKGRKNTDKLICHKLEQQIGRFTNGFQKPSRQARPATN